MNISKTSEPMAIKFYLKHHWDGGKAALGFGPVQIVTISITSQTSSKFGQIRPRTAELAALERLEKSPDL